MSTTPAGHHKRASSDTLLKPIDLNRVEDGLKRWVKVVGGKMKLRNAGRLGSGERDEVASSKPVELMSSVFGKGGLIDAQTPIRGARAQPTDDEFTEIVTSVKRAISADVQPKLIAKGSSGSYFAREERGHVVAVFKPKDEEPYGRANPKLIKRLHRSLFGFIGFGRACLIPNLSYISEVAASHLDRRLALGLVPTTELASLSSPAFFYDWLDRTAYVTKGKPLPEKIGSFQLFMHAFKDATQWLKEHPWPNGVAVDDSRKTKSSRHHLRRLLRLSAGLCGRAGADVLNDEESAQGEREEREERSAGRFRWTPELKDAFIDELQKLVVLDYLMLNTDRGLDNFMIQYSISSPPSADRITKFPSPVTAPSTLGRLSQVSFEDRQGRVHIAAIDNSLSWPWKHPDGWRSYPYGWLFLPVSLIGQPFGQTIREHLIPLLSSPVWWERTIVELRQLFELDAGFNEVMFGRQMAVFKGQGLNLLHSLQSADEGPLDLCRRTKLEVWTDEIEMPDDPETERRIAETLGRRQTAASTTDAHVQPATSSAAQDDLHAVQQRRPSDAEQRTSNTSLSRPRPQSSTAESTAWRSFEGVSGVSVLKLLDKESRRHRRSGRARSKQPATASANNDGRGAFSDGEEAPSARSDARRSPARRPGTTRRSFSTGPVSAADETASIDALNASLMDSPPSSSSARPPARDGRRGSYGSAEPRGSTEWLLTDEQAQRRTRVVKVERVKEVHGRAWFNW